MIPTRKAGVLVAAGFIGLATLAWSGARAARDAHATQARRAAVCPRPGTIAAPAASASRPALATSGQIFASHAWSRRVSIVDLATGKVTSLPAGVADAHEVAVSPDGRWGVAADFGDYKGDYKFDGHRLAVFDLATKRLARVIDLGRYLGPHDIVFHPVSPNRAFVTTQTTRHVIEVDVEAGRVLGATETRAVGSHTMAITADGRTAFTANEPEGSVSRLDLVGRAFVAKHVVGPGSTEGIGVTPDGREVWMGFMKDGEVRVVDGTTGALLATLTGFITPARLTLSPDGSRAVISDGGCKVTQVADVRTRRVLGPIVGLGDGMGVAKVLPDNRTAVVAMLDQGVVAMVDLEERRVISRHDLGSRIDAAAWGPKP
jgi:DNA-binding beta-propeller fold protein YncE